MAMEISQKELHEAMVGNDVERVAEVLEGFELFKDGTPPQFTSEDRELTKTLLSVAAALSWKDKLSAEMAAELVERTAMTVDIFPFLRLVTIGLDMSADEVDEDAIDKIPGRVQAALAKNKPSNRVDRMIEEMDEETFKTLISYIAYSGDVTETHVKFNLPLIRYVRAHELVPEDLFFAFMAGSLRRTIDDGRLGGALGGLLGDSLGGLLGLGIIGALADDD